MWRINEREEKILAKIREYKSKKSTPKRKKIIKTSKDKTSEDKTLDEILSIIKSEERPTLRLMKVIKHLNDN